MPTDHVLQQIVSSPRMLYAPRVMILGENPEEQSYRRKTVSISKYIYIQYLYVYISIESLACQMSTWYNMYSVKDLLNSKVIEALCCYILDSMLYARNQQYILLLQNYFGLAISIENLIVLYTTKRVHCTIISTQ